MENIIKKTKKLILYAALTSSVLLPLKSHAFFDFRKPIFDAMEKSYYHQHYGNNDIPLQLTSFKTDGKSFSLNGCGDVSQIQKFPGRFLFPITNDLISKLKDAYPNAKDIARKEFARYFCHHFSNEIFPIIYVDGQTPVTTDEDYPKNRAMYNYCIARKDLYSDAYCSSRKPTRATFEEFKKQLKNN